MDFDIKNYPFSFHNSILNLWECEYCFDKLNSHFLHNCKNCNRYKDLECPCIWCKTDWKCEICSYTNIGTVKICENCNTPTEYKLSTKDKAEIKKSNIDFRCSGLLYRQNAGIYNLFDTFLFNKWDVKYLNLHNTDLPTDDIHLKNIIQEYRKSIENYF